MVQGHRKLLVKAVLLPSILKGQRGAATPLAFYDLGKTPFEVGEEVLPQHSKTAQKMTLELLKFITGATLET